MKKIDHMMMYNPYRRDRLEADPLAWDTSCPFIDDADLGSDFKMERNLRALREGEAQLDGVYTTETADHRQWSYWPSEVPVLPEPGYRWFDYGPIAYDLHLWGQIPHGKVPSAEEQRQQIEKHYQMRFSGGRVPDRLNYWLKEHGLTPITWWRRTYKAIFFAAAVVGSYGLLKTIYKKGKR